MRRPTVLLGVAAVVLLSLIAAGRVSPITIAQEGTPPRQGALRSPQA